MEFKNYCKTYFLDIITKHYFDFNGREGRKVFWLFVLNIFVIGFVLGVFSGALSTIFSLAILLPHLGLFVRRLHDIDFSGWWILLGVIPLIGGIALIVLACIPGTEGENKYGPIIVNTIAE